MEKRILIIALNNFNQLFLTNTLRKIDRLTMEASLFSSTFLITHINLTSWVVSNHNYH